MESDIIKSESSFSFHIDGDSSIDAFSLSKIIGNMAELTEIAVHTDEPEANVNVSVTALKPGSFVIDFSAVCGIVNTMISNAPNMLSAASNAISTIKGFFEIRKLLNGKAPQSVKEISENSICVTNDNGESTIVNKSSGAVINNPRAENLTQNISITVYNNSSANGFSIDDKNGSISFNNDDLLKMNKPIPIIDNITRKVSAVNNTELLIKKPDILGHSAWSFRFNGKNIEARILDDDFLDYIQEGNFTIKVGSYINADLEVAYDLTSDGLLDEKPPKYTVTKVYGGIKNDIDNQLKLDPQFK